VFADLEDCWSEGKQRGRLIGGMAVDWETKIPEDSSVTEE
jgi:hypothetical protein